MKYAQYLVDDVVIVVLIWSEAGEKRRICFILVWGGQTRMPQVLKQLNFVVAVFPVIFGEQKVIHPHLMDETYRHCKKREETKHHNAFR